ncbi:uncharacterized protein MKS88_000241 [Plasmodium brasilianum]|uniref:uncharacterized protein n=1 Tax=Plasmodium brasilianum TaxID=5824 RepID=UPI00350E4A91|nr:hypothetical protein MKS88_000241 [Plasmodium brasilianum]
MGGKIKFCFLVKIAIIINWIYHFSSDMGIFKKSAYKKNNGSKLYVRTYRVIAIYKQNKDSRIIGLNEKIQYNVLHEEKDISIKDNENTGKMNSSNRKLSSDFRGHKSPLKYKSSIYETKKCSYLEKKIFKELGYEVFLKNNRTISNKTYKKIMLKKCGLRIAVPLLLFLILLITLIMDLLWSCGLARGLSTFLKQSINVKEWRQNLGQWLWENPPFSWLLRSAKHVQKEGGGTVNLVTNNFFFIVTYVILFFALSVTFISAVIYFHKKVKKFQKIKFRRR